MSQTDDTYPTLEARLIDKYRGAYLNDDGDVVREQTGIEYQDGHAMESTYEQNLTKLFQDGTRETRNVEILVIEAELLDEHGELGNPAEPYDEAVEAEARSQIEERGLTPAWEGVG